MLLLWFVLILTVKKQQNISMIVLMFLSLAHYALDIFASGKQVSSKGECGPEIRVSFHFYGPEKSIKLAKKYNKKDRLTNLNKTVKHCLK